MSGPDRAPAGGQVGMNGEFYAGGVFLPSTGLPKRAASFRRARARQAFIEPGVSVVVPEGLSPIYPSIREFAVFEDGLAKGKYTEEHPAVRYHFESYEALQELIDAYNEGDRYI